MLPACNTDKMAAHCVLGSDIEGTGCLGKGKAKRLLKTHLHIGESMVGLEKQIPHF